MKKQILLSCALAWAVMAGAETIDITTFRYAGPYVVQAPFQVDSVDVNSKTFVSGRLLVGYSSFCGRIATGNFIYRRGFAGK